MSSLDDDLVLLNSPPKLQSHPKLLFQTLSQRQRTHLVLIYLMRTVMLQQSKKSTVLDSHVKMLVAVVVGVVVATATAFQS